MAAFFTTCSAFEVDPEACAAILQQDGIIIYPTETFFAIGCHVDNGAGVAAVYACKKRSVSKPLPIICANIAQANDLADLACAPPGLLKNFWPGPLSLILPARRPLPAGIAGANGKICLRVSSHPGASALAASGPLIASSANISGQAPVKKIADLAPELLESCLKSGLPFAMLNAAAGPCELASTIVEPCRAAGGWRLNILRAGAICAAQLQTVGNMP